MGGNGHLLLLAAALATLHLACAFEVQSPASLRGAFRDGIPPTLYVRATNEAWEISSAMPPLSRHLATSKTLILANAAITADLLGANVDRITDAESSARFEKCGVDPGIDARGKILVMIGSGEWARGDSCSFFFLVFLLLFSVHNFSKFPFPPLRQASSRCRLPAARAKRSGSHMRLEPTGC
jgi:hypothetical protein